VDVVSDGELIDAGQLIEVIRVDGNRIVVRKFEHGEAKE
jgi:membrane protein implicated in regulation of membrane protease activity